MSLVLPPQYTDTHDEEVELTSPNTEQLKQKLVHNINYLGMLTAPGVIHLVQTNQIGVTIPDSGIWQQCDGSEITNPNSPLRSIGVENRFVPDIDERVIKASNFPSSTSTSGQYDFTGTHTHTISARVPSTDLGLTGEFGDDRRIHVKTHTHPLGDDLQNFTVNFPASFNLAAFMKVV